MRAPATGRLTKLLSRTGQTSRTARALGAAWRCSPASFGVDNRLLLQTLRHAPDVLRGVAVVADDAKLVQLQRLHEAGVRGIRLNLMGQTNDADHLRALPSAWWSNVMAAGCTLNCMRMSDE